ncbi:MAG: hypothetical protein QG639_556 [Patescibacteria group bacterium]|nr:hypothetical protein [Patescibacteria group bacterium]
MLVRNSLSKIFASICLIVTCLFLFVAPISAQEVEPPYYFTGKVTEVVEQQLVDQENEFYTQIVAVVRDDTGEKINVPVGSQFQPLNKQQLMTVGKKLVLAEQKLIDGSTEVVVADVYRMNTVYWLLGLFVVVVLIVGGLRGAASFIGMMISVAILLSYIVPQILSGSNPVIISLLGSLAIGALTIYIAHGFSKKSHVALASMISILFLVAGLAYMAVKAAQLVGLGSEEAYFLQFSDTARINLQGLLLGGILLGALGVLDDITISQASIVFELKEAKKDISWHELYERALSVGRDHVASLVNTLVLAYAGANLPLFLLFILNEQSPDWVTLNSDILVEEIVRTLAGSIGLVLAVPLSSFIAATVVTRGDNRQKTAKKAIKAT